MSVTEGVVAVTAQDTSVDIDVGFGAVVEEGGASSDPIALLPSPVFKRVPARLATGDTLEWFQLFNATGYEARLSTDEAAQQTLTTFNVEKDVALDLRTSLDDSAGTDSPVESGDYFLTVRARDKNDLPGFSSSTRVTLADIDTTIPPVDTAISREGSEFLVSVVDPSDTALGYEIQISRDAEFSDPLAVDVSSTGTAVFRTEGDQVFSRARQLINPFTVSEFEEISSN